MLPQHPPVLPPLGHPVLGGLQEVEQVERVLGLHPLEEGREGEGAEEVEAEGNRFSRAIHYAVKKCIFFMNKNL